MKFTIESQLLKDALSKVSRAVDNRSTLPVLSNVLLDVKGDVLTVSATNLAVAIQIKTEIENKTNEDWNITVPYKTLANFASVRPTDKPIIITHKPDDVSIVLSQGRWRSKLKGIHGDEYPQLPDYQTLANESTLSFTTLSTDFAFMLGQVDFSSEKDGSRPVLNGVHVFVDNNVLQLESTDGFRLSRHNTKITPIKMEKSVLIGNHVITGLIPLLKKYECDVNIVCTDMRVGIQGEDWLVVGQLDANSAFPDTAPIIPTTSNTNFSVMPNDLMLVLNTMQIYARESTGNIGFDVDKNDLAINTSTAELGDTQESLSINRDGDHSAFSLNIKYLIDVVRVSNPDEQINFSVVDAMNPVVVTQNDSLWVIMPMMQGR